MDAAMKTLVHGLCNRVVDLTIYCTESLSNQLLELSGVARHLLLQVESLIASFFDNVGVVGRPTAIPREEL